MLAAAVGKDHKSSFKRLDAQLFVFGFVVNSFLCELSV